MDYTNEVNTAIAAEPAGSTLAEQMNTIASYPTFVWMDHIGAIAGGAANSGRLGLQGHINAAIAQQKGSEPVVVQVVIYDLPDRDCAALASNGELSIAGGDIPIGQTTPLTGTGIQEYENDYINPIFNILSQYKNNPNVRFVLVIEDDSLPNMITNTGLSFSLPNCIAANDGQSGSPSLNGIYVQGIQYALNEFHSLPNVYNYLDIGHHGWLGWPSNSTIAYPFFASVAKGTTAGFASVDGFITNTANYGPTKEPYMTAFSEPGGGIGTGTLCASPEACSGTFYQFDPMIDEEDYAASFEQGLISAGFPSTLGFLIDTSRNGWGGPLRPTGASTSTVLDTFVDDTKIDERDDMGQWCNQENQGVGVPPTVNPGYFSNLQAYVWVKPPGESDGNYPGSNYGGTSSKTGDPNCDPAHSNLLANGMLTGAIPDSPPAGTFWITEFVQDVQNGYPVVPATPLGSSGSFAISTAGTVTVEQGMTTASSVTVNDSGSFDGTVTLSVSGLPAGVTATFTPASVTGSAGSSLTFVASATAVPGTYPLIVTGVSGTTTKSEALSLVVIYAPNFYIIVPSAPVTLTPGTNPTDTFTVTFVGGLPGSVSVSAGNLPSGVNANFAPSSVNAPGGSITVNFNAQTITVPGQYTIQIIGTNGTITHSTPLTLIIPGPGGSFSLSATAPTLSIAQGGSGNDSIRITDVSPFAGSVTLVNSALPIGVTVTYGTNPATASSTISFAVSNTTIPGSYPITITGSSTGIPSATTTITLTVTGTGSFNLSAAPAALSIVQGKSATDTITVTDTGTFTGPVTITLSGTVTGETVSGCSTPITGDGSCTITVSAGSSTAPGIYNLTVTGTSGTTVKVITIPVTVTPATGYTLSVSPATLTIPQCGSGTATIGVTDIGGFTGSISLTATGLPTGVTAAFAPASATSTSTLTLSVSCTTTPGTYPVTITGISGTLTSNNTLTLIVTAKSGFTLSASPSPLTVVQGKSGTETISITDQGGFTGGVTLVATGQPAGVTVTYGTNPATATSQLAFAVGSSVTAGTYPITVTGTSGALTPATTSFNLVVTPTGGFSCHVVYTISSQWPGGFGGGLNIENTGSTAISNWTLTWTYANGQTITQLWNGNVTQSGANVTVTNLSYNGSIPAGGSYSAAGFNGTWNNVTNSVPTNFAVNGTTCQ
jgi:cellulose 1,4-beta-cellobiosidase